LPSTLLSTEPHPCARSDNSLGRPWCAARCLDLSGVQLGGRRPRGHAGQFRQDRCDGPRPCYRIHPPRFIDRGQSRAAELHAARLGGCNGYPAAARNDAERALKEARELGQAATLMYALWWASWKNIFDGTYATAQPLLDELAALADEKDAASFWKATEIAFRGALFALTGNASDAVRAITSGLTSLRSTGATLYEPWHLFHWC
jgi:hypothetical protein